MLELLATVWPFLCFSASLHSKLLVNRNCSSWCAERGKKHIVKEEEWFKWKALQSLPSVCDFYTVTFFAGGKVNVEECFGRE